MPCTKQLTINEAHVIPPCFYYSMEVVSGAAPNEYIPNLGLSDAYTHLYLHGGSAAPAPPVGPGVSIVPGHINLGGYSRANAFWAGQLGRTHTLIADGGAPATTNLLNLANRSWTARFWIKNDTGVPGPPAVNKRLWCIRHNTWGDSIDVYRAGTGVWFENYYRIILTPVAGLPINLLSAMVPSNVGQTWRAWHRVVITYDAATQTATIRINNDAPTSSTVPGFVLASTDRYIDVLSYQADTIFFNYTMDEFIFRYDKVWDAADAFYDWNGGAGRTYPDIR